MATTYRIWTRTVSIGIGDQEQFSAWNLMGETEHDPGAPAAKNIAGRMGISPGGPDGPLAQVLWENPTGTTAAVYEIGTTFSAQAMSGDLPECPVIYDLDT